MLIKISIIRLQEKIAVRLSPASGLNNGTQLFVEK